MLPWEGVFACPTVGPRIRTVGHCPPYLTLATPLRHAGLRAQGKTGYDWTVGQIPWMRHLAGLNRCIVDSLPIVVKKLRKIEILRFQNVLIAWINSRIKSFPVLKACSLITCACEAVFAADFKSLPASNSQIVRYNYM